MTDETYSGLLLQKGLIDGEWTGAASGRTVDVHDPATQAVIGAVPDMGWAETRAAIEAASRAFGSWKRKSHAERAGLLETWHRLILENLEELLPGDFLERVVGLGEVDPQDALALVVLGAADDRGHAAALLGPAADGVVIGGGLARHG